MSQEIPCVPEGYRRKNEFVSSGAKELRLKRLLIWDLNGFEGLAGGHQEAELGEVVLGVTK